MKLAERADSGVAITLLRVSSRLELIVETAVPARLGRSFRWLLSSTLVNNAGDGVVVAAGPLLVASQTHDPFLVSLALLMEYLPALLFSVFTGVVADRVERRRMVIVSNLLRAVILAVLVFTIVSGTVSILLVLSVLFVLGTAENFADSASSALLPGVVKRPDLGIANSRMQGAFILLNQLIGPPIGAFLFAVGMALPFAANAAAFALGAVLISRVAISSESVIQRAAGQGSTFWSDLKEGVRWLVGHPPMRTLALTIFAFNITYGAAWSVLVLYAGEQLHMSAIGFGLLTTASALGGIIGISLYGSLERRFALGDIMRVGLVVETFTHLALALTTSAVFALVVFVVFGAHAFIWGTTATTVRQRAVPNELMGRVGGVYRLAIVGGLVIGTPLGGILASNYGITAPFWFGFIGSAILVVLLWGQFGLITHSEPAAA
jgi:MFS family permease